MSAGRGENESTDALTVFVDGRHFHLVKGMSVRHALLAAGMILNDREIPAVLDEWGNLISLDGALTEGTKLFTSKHG
ncbi:MAG: hypothetical protein WCW53_09375 [Syntrophales bacterium]|jgi:hypothetical protein